MDIEINKIIEENEIIQNNFVNILSQMNMREYKKFYNNVSKENQEKMIFIAKNIFDDINSLIKNESEKFYHNCIINKCTNINYKYGYCIEHIKCKFVIKLFRKTRLKCIKSIYDNNEIKGHIYQICNFARNEYNNIHNKIKNYLDNQYKKLYDNEQYSVPNRIKKLYKKKYGYDANIKLKKLSIRDFTPLYFKEIVINNYLKNNKYYILNEIYELDNQLLSNKYRQYDFNKIIDQKVKYIIIFYKNNQDKYINKIINNDIINWFEKNNDLDDITNESRLQRMIKKCDILKKIEKYNTLINRFHHEYENLFKLVSKFIKDSIICDKLLSYNFNGIYSHIEEYIYEHLIFLFKKYNFFIYITREKIFIDNCYINPLRFDFFGIIYCNNAYFMEFVIEYDGIQHWSGWKNNKNNRKYINTNDILKDFYCWKKGISILRLCYEDFDDIDQFKNYINNFIQKLYYDKIPIYEFINKEKYDSRLMFLENEYL